LPNGKNYMDKLSETDLDRLIKAATKGNGKPPEKKLSALADIPAHDKPGAILAAVHDFTGRFVAYPSDDAHVAHVLWIAHTHLMEAWESTPRLAFLSPEPSSGKTRALEVTELLSAAARGGVGPDPC